jgi:hypothetical protein
MKGRSQYETLDCNSQEEWEQQGVQSYTHSTIATIHQERLNFQCAAVMGLGMCVHDTVNTAFQSTPLF